MTNIQEFFKSLLEKVPGLTDLYKDHLFDNDEFLPHVFMGDVTRYVCVLAQKVNRGSEALKPELITIVDFLEEGLIDGNDELRNIIEVSFVENLEKADPCYALIKKCMGPNLLLSLEATERLYPE